MTTPTSRRATLAGVGLVLVVVWLTGLLRFRGWIATGDHAILQLRLERIAGGHLPLDGAFSRFGAHHPGPAREWVVGAGYWIAGGRTAALPATAIVVNWSLLAASIVAAWRTGGRAMAAAATAGGSVLVWGLAADLHSTWNPYFPVVAGYAAIWGVTAVVEDARRWLLPVLAGSLLAQVHATGLLVGVAVVATALAATACDARRHDDWHRVAAAVGVTIAAWLGPLIDLVNGGTWNLAALARSGGGEPRLGLVRGAEHVAQKLLPWSAFRGETRTPSAPPEPPPTAPVVVLAVAVVALGLYAWRTRSGSRRTLAIVALSVCFVATASFALLRGFEHMYLFAPLTGALLAPFVVATSAVLDRFSDRLRAVPAGVLIAAMAIVPAVASVRGWTEYESIQSSPFDRGLRGAVVPEVRPGRSYTVVAADMIGVSAEGDVALYVLQSGGEPRSDQFSLDLPTPVPGDDTFVVAMRATLECLSASDARELIIAESSDVGLPVGVFLLDGATADRTLAICAP